MEKPGDISLILPPTEDDDDHEWQRELRSFHDQLLDAGVDFIPFRVTALGIHIVEANQLAPEFIVPIAKLVVPALTAAVTGWFAGRTGRKVRLKVGDIEVEASTPAEIDQLLERAQALRASQEGKTDEA